MRHGRLERRDDLIVNGESELARGLARDVRDQWKAAVQDEPRPSLTQDEAFANAPDRDDDHFRVPPA